MKDIVFQRGVTPSGGGTGEVKRFFDRHGYAVQWPLHMTLGQVCVGLLGVGERLLSSVHDDGVEFAVVLVCSSQIKVE